MTNSNWKPVAHAMACGLRPGIGGQCKCNGTRWHGYGERVGDFAAVWALTGWLAALSAPVQPAAVADEYPSRGALMIIAESVSAALDRAGFEHVDDPGEAIDILASRASAAVAVPDCFMALYKSALGMTHGQDWNNGTHAAYHRDALINATADCAAMLSARATPAKVEDGGLSKEWYRRNAMAERDCAADVGAGFDTLMATDDLRDGERFRWLTEDHADAETRGLCRRIIESLPMRSLSGARIDIDAAILSASQQPANKGGTDRE